MTLPRRPRQPDVDTDVDLSRRDRHDLTAQLWSKADQHRFEDRLDRRLEAIEQSVDRLSTRQAWMGGAVALALVAGTAAIRLLSLAQP